MDYTKRTITVKTSGRGSYSLDEVIKREILTAEFNNGLLHVFCRHTSASLMICENADPAVRQDLERFMADLVPDGDPRFLHQDEGPDDMPAHIRSILTLTEITLPVNNRQLELGTWQSVFLWEHRTAPQQRQLMISMMGDYLDNSA